MSIKTVLQIAGMTAVLLTAVAGAQDVNTPAFQIAGTFYDVSEDGKQILVGNKKSVKLLDAESGKEIFTVNAKGIVSSRFSPDGKRFLTGHWKFIKLWDSGNGREIGTLDDGKKGIVPVLFDLDEKRIVTYKFKGKRSVVLWDMENGREISTLSNSKYQFCPHFFSQLGGVLSPDGKYLLVRGDDFSHLTLFNAENGQTVKTINVAPYGCFRRDDNGAIHNFRVSSDGKKIIMTIAGSLLFRGPNETALPRDFSIVIWDIDSEKETWSFKIGRDHISEPNFTPDNRYAVFVNSNLTISRIDLENGEETKTNLQMYYANNPVYNAVIRFSPDATKILAEYPAGRGGFITNTTIRLWDAASNKEISSFETGGQGVSSVSQDLKLAVSINKDNSIRLWDVETGKVIKTFAGHSKKNTNNFGAVLSPCGSRIISYSGSEIKVWKL